MPITEALLHNSSVEVVQAFFLAKILDNGLHAAVKKALTRLWKDGQKPVPTQRLMRHGLKLFVSAVEMIAPERVSSLNLGHLAQSLRTSFESAAMYDNAADITAMRAPSVTTDRSLELKDDLSDLSLCGVTRILTSALKETEIHEPTASEITPVTEENSHIVAQSVIALFSAVFREVGTILEDEKVDLLHLLFDSEDPESSLSNNDLHVLFAYLKVYMAEILENKNFVQFAYIDKAVLLLYDALSTLVLSMAADRFATWEKGSRAKFLHRIFYLVDFATVFYDILVATTPIQQIELMAPEAGEAFVLQEKYPKIEYTTTLRLFALMSTFSSCPSRLSFDKDFFLVDIGNANEPLSNLYRQFMTRIDYSELTNIKILQSRFIPMLSVLYNYFYDLQPDLLLESFKHTSFFGWITGHTFSSGLYSSIDTKAEYTNWETAIQKSKFPFYNSEDTAIQFVNHKDALNVIEKKVCELPSFFILTLEIYDLIDNGSFVEYFIGESTERVRVFDLWLCLSSYISQHQRTSDFGRPGVRASLFALLKLTANTNNLSRLKTHRINENVWKLCHQKAPYVSLVASGSDISALLYCIDVLQITLRFNIPKTSNLDNVKIALTVLLQILKECEVRPFAELINYPWKGLYETLVHLVLFISRNRNEEDVKSVIEEIFFIFEVILSPSLAKIIEKSPDYFIIGSHIIKSMNYDLLYIILNKYEPLLHLFEKYIIDETNFRRTRRTFATLEKEFNLKEYKQIDESVVVTILNKLSLLSEDVLEGILVNQSGFNYSETFKFWAKAPGPFGLDDEAEYFHTLVQLYKQK